MSIRMRVATLWNSAGLRWARSRAASSPQMLKPAYSTTAITIHWLTAAALSLAIALGWRMRDAGGVERESVLALHMSIGISILLLTVLRMGWRITHRPPPMTASDPWERWFAQIAHGLFYVFLFLIPLLGWLNVSSSNSAEPNRLFGLVPWPNIPGVARLSGVGTTAETAHRVLAYSLCVLLCFHIAGAVKHHLTSPGDGFSRILPGANRKFCWRTISMASVLIVLFVLGAGYIDRALPKGLHLVQVATVERVPIDPRKSKIFASVVQPILNEKCVRCHGGRARRGGLRLDSFASVSRGGESGKVIKPSKVDESELVRRIMMPASSSEVMPPADLPALTLAEGQLILWWIGAGADDTSTILAATPPPLVQRILEEIGVRNESPVFAQPVALSDEQTLAALRRTFQVHVLFSGGGFLRAQPKFDPDPTQLLSVDALSTVAPQLVWLDLSNADVSEAQLAALAGLRKLQRLNLSRTRANDATVRRLIGLPFLETLNLYGTAVTDSALGALGRMPSLNSVYLSETAVTQQAIAQFSASHPQVRIVWQASEHGHIVTIDDKLQ